MDGTQKDTTTRAQQLEKLISEAAAQPGLSAVMELSRQDWYQLATTTQVQMPTVERVGVSTDTVSALI